MRVATHRERVLTALEHREPDRVPLDIGGVFSIHVEAYRRLLHHLGWEEEARRVRYNPTSLMAVLDDRFLQMADVDCRSVSVGPGSTILDENSYRDEWGVLWRRAEGGHFINWKGPLQDLEEPTQADLDRVPWPDPQDPEKYRGLEERVRRIRAETDCALVLNLGYGIVREAQRVRGFAEFFEDLLLRPAFAEALMERVLEVSAGVARRALQLVGDLVDVVNFPDDMGFQDRCYVRPELYRRLIRPYHARLVEAMKSSAPARVMLHSDGAIYDIIKDFVEIGIDAINPVQTTAVGMEPGRLKREFGASLVFWGAVDTQRVLPFGSPGEVKNFVRHLIHTLGPGGGYVVGSYHNIQAEVPPENILAMVEAVREFGTYPLRG